MRQILGRFAFMIYGPTALFSIGQGAVVPLIPVYAVERGADAALGALIAGFLVVGQLCGNLPGGWLAARIGERYTMAISSVVSLIGVLGMALLPGLPALGISTFLMGLGAAGFGIARHAFMTTRVPLAFRARALALLGGSFRLGTFIGPFLAAGLVALTGSGGAGIWLLLVLLIAVLALVLFGPDPEEAAEARPARRLNAAREPFIAEDTGEAVTEGLPTVGATARIGLLRVIWRNRRVLSRLGIASASLAAVRSAKQTVLPIVGVELGLDAGQISLVVGIAGAVEFALFYASGQVMDRFGRLWAVLPSMLLMGFAFLGLALVLGLGGGDLWFPALAVVIGVGNGLSAGILLTLGADTAPQDDPAPYLGAWRTLTDGGGAAAPLIFSALTAAASIVWATAAMGVLGLLGAVAFLRWVPMFVPEARSDRPEPGR